MSKVTILQIGRENWMNQLELPKNITWIYLRAGLASDIKARMKQGKIKSFDAVLVDDPLALWLFRIYVIIWPPIQFSMMKLSKLSIRV